MPIRCSRVYTRQAAGPSYIRVAGSAFLGRVIQDSGEAGPARYRGAERVTLGKKGSERPTRCQRLAGYLLMQRIDMRCSFRRFHRQEMRSAVSLFHQRFARVRTREGGEMCIPMCIP
jgi:hypothetical protein